MSPLDPHIAAHGTGYADYFRTGLYASRYGGVPLRSVAATQGAVNIVHERNATQPVTIMDYGCGDGRYYEHVIQSLENRNQQPIPTSYVGYDVTLEALQHLEKKLHGWGYFRIGGEKLHELQEGKSSDKGYVGPIYKKGDKLVTLVHGKITDDQAHTRALLSAFQPDVSLCMFGVLSHIPKRENRQNVMKLIADVTHGPVVISVPNIKSHAEKLEVYDAKRAASEDVGMATEQGDIYYGRDLPGGRNISIYYHLYNPREFQEDLEASGLASHVMGCANVMTEAALTKSASLPVQIADFNRSVSMSGDKLDDHALYLIAEAMPPQGSAKGYATPDHYSAAAVTDMRTQLQPAGAHQHR